MEEGYLNHPSQEDGRITNSNVAISPVDPVVSSPRSSSSDRYIRHEDPVSIPSKSQYSKELQLHREKNSRNTRLQSVQRGTTPVLESQLPILSPDFNSTQFLEVLHYLESGDDKTYLQLLYNMVTLLRASYLLYGRNYIFPLDYCTIAVIPNMGNSLLLFPPDALQIDASLTDVLKTSNINFLLTLIERRMSSIECSPLIKMDFEDILDKWEQTRASYFEVLSALNMVLRKTIKNLL